MKFAAFICITCLMLTGVAFASGMTPAIKTVRNASIAQVTVQTTQTTEEPGVIGNLIAPIARVLPTATATSNAQVIQQEIATNTTILSPTLSVTPDLNGLTPTQKVEKLNLQHSSVVSTTDPCMDQSSLQVMDGKMYVIYVQDSPGPFWGGLLLNQKDKKLYTLVSTNQNIYSLMQTAMIADREVSAAGYSAHGDPNDTFFYLYPSYHVCWMSINT